MFELLHVTDLLLAVSGLTVATSCDPAPAFKFNVDVFKLTPSVTVSVFTLQLAVNPPSTVVTVIVASPFAIASA